MSLEGLFPGKTPREIPADVQSIARITRMSVFDLHVVICLKKVNKL